MEETIYITDEEREKCKRVIDAFAELYDLTDTVVTDAKKYGFVKLQCYGESLGFETMQLFTESEKLFEDLWEDWLEEQVMIQAADTPLVELEYDEIFARLPEETQAELMAKKSYFAEKSGI